MLLYAESEQDMCQASSDCLVDVPTRHMHIHALDNAYRIIMHRNSAAKCPVFAGTSLGLLTADLRNALRQVLAFMRRRREEHAAARRRRAPAGEAAALRRQAAERVAAREHQRLVCALLLTILKSILGLLLLQFCC